MDLMLFAAKRLFSALGVLFAVSILTFLMFYTMPNGDPAVRMAGRTATPETIEVVRQAYGFDQPIWVQYGRLMEQIFTGTIQSYEQRVPVMGQIARGLPITVSLAVGGAIVWMVVGMGLGILAALRAGRASDVAVTAVSFAGISSPQFVVGSLLLLVFSYRLGWLPPGGYVKLTEDPIGWFTHLILPWITLATLYIGVYVQVLRTSLLEALTTDAVRTARAKGLSQRRVIIRHGLRVSLIPITSLWGLDFAAVLAGGTLVVEKVFNLGGIGQYAADSIGALDVPPVLVITMLGACFVVVANAVVDIAYAFLDPRIRVSGG